MTVSEAVPLGSTDFPDVDLRHHGDRETGPGMVDFAVNVEAVQPPPFLLEGLRHALEGVGRYPDSTGARHTLAELHRIPPESVLVTSGGAEAFTLIARLPWRAPAVVHPQFTEPEAALLAAGHHPTRAMLTAATEFGLSQAIVPSDADLVMVGNPTNPTSRLHLPGDLATLSSPSRTVVVDEAFMDAVEGPQDGRFSIVARAAEEPGLVVVRSLTKTFSIPGLRIGYAVAHPSLIARLADLQPPWSVGGLACAAAVLCAGGEAQAYAAELRRALPARLAALEAGLEVLGFEVVAHPAGPFVLAHHVEGARLREQLRERGVAVRRGDTFPGLGHEWLRVAARDVEQQADLFTALRDALDTLPTGAHL